MQNAVRGRFAPSPSGRLHLGNIMSSLLAWLDIRALGGTMLFRLEDLDPDRSDSDCARLMADDLLWLGLDWDEGWPVDQGYSQGERTELYESALRKLRDMGLTYECWCSRAERLSASAPHPGERHDAGCSCSEMSGEEIKKRLLMGRKPALKVHAPDKVYIIQDEHCGKYTAHLRPGASDFIVRRSDGVFAYQLAVSADDAAMGISRVVRAHDLLESAPRQAWLIETLGGIVPTYCHAPLLVAPDGRKLSKREGDLNMEILRERYTPRELVGRLAYTAGLIPEPAPLSPAELVPIFDWVRVPTDNIVIPEGLF